MSRGYDPRDEDEDPREEPETSQDLIASLKAKAAAESSEMHESAEETEDATPATRMLPPHEEPTDPSRGEAGNPSELLTDSMRVLERLNEQIRVLQDVRRELVQEIATQSAPLIASKLEPEMLRRLENMTEGPIKALALTVELSKSQTSALGAQISAAKTVLTRLEEASGTATTSMSSAVTNTGSAANLAVDGIQANAQKALGAVQRSAEAARVRAWVYFLVTVIAAALASGATAWWTTRGVQEELLAFRESLQHGPEVASPKPPAKGAKRSAPR